MSTYLFDTEAEATDADADTDDEYSFNDISEDTSCDDESVHSDEKNETASSTYRNSYVNDNNNLCSSCLKRWVVSSQCRQRR